MVLWFLWYSCAAAVVGGSFLFGYNLGVVNIPELTIESAINTSAVGNCRDNAKNASSCSGFTAAEMNLIWPGMVVAPFLVGGFIGGLLSGYPANRFGRKPTLMVNSLLTFVGSVVFFFANGPFEVYPVMLGIGRLIVGVQCGVGSSVTPMYLSEIAPKRLRGLCGTLHQLVIGLGMLVGVGLSFTAVLGNDDLLFAMGEMEFLSWNVLFSMQALFALLHVAMMLAAPESPQWLLQQNSASHEARFIIARLNNCNPEDELVLNELNDILSAFGEPSDGRPGVFEESMDGANDSRLNDSDSDRLLGKERSQKSVIRRACVVTILAQTSQQMCGVAATVFYSNKLFINAGLSSIEAQFAVLIFSVVNFGAVFIEMALVERFGRRVLLIGGLIALAGLDAFLNVCLEVGNGNQGWAAAAAVTTIVFIGVFNLGPGPIPWFIGTEVFDTRHRKLGSTLAVLTNNFFSLIVAVGFPKMEEAIGGYSFSIFVGLTAVVATLLFLLMPETRNAPISEVQRRMAENRFFNALRI